MRVEWDLAGFTLAVEDFAREFSPLAEQCAMRWRLELSARRTRDWAVAFVLDPNHLIAANDPVALRLVKEADGMVMPVPPDLTPALASALIDLIDQRSGQRAAALSPPPVAATAEDVALGGELFSGTRALQRRGPACLSCHDVAGLRRLGGGTFGPDLTRAHARLGGSRGLTGWLAAPPTPVMRATFRTAPLEAAEVRALTAYLERAASGGADVPARSRGRALAAISLPLVAAVLAVIGVAGRRRLRGVRRPLVDAATGGRR